MSLIFVSYDRSDKGYASQLIIALELLGHQVWIDFEKLQLSVIWGEEIGKAIKQSTAFIYLLSPESIRPGSYCKVEFNDAQKLGKKIIPILLPSIVDHREVPEEIGKYHYVEWNTFGRDPVDIGELEKIIRTNFEWAEFHAKLTEQADVWVKGGHRQSDSLLNRREVNKAKQKFSEISQDELPQQTQTIIEYVLANERKLKLQLTVGTTISFGILMTICLISIYAVFQSLRAEKEAASAVPLRATTVAAEATAQSERDRAEQQAEIADQQRMFTRAGELAKEADASREGYPITSFLLSVEAFNIVDNYQTRSTLLDSVQAYPHLYQFLDAESASGPSENTGGINGIAFSPDGKLFASAGAAATISLWDTSTWKRIGSIKLDTDTSNYYDSSIVSIAFSPDGKMLAAGSRTGTIALWDLVDQQPLRILSKHQAEVISLAFSPDGKTLASCTENEALIWNMASGIPAPLYSDDYDYFSNVAFSADGKFLALGSDYNSPTRLYNTNTWQIANEVAYESYTSNVVFSPDSNILVTGDFENHISFWNVTTGELLRTLEGDGNTVDTLTFSPDGKTIVYSDTYGEIFFMDVATGQSRKTLEWNSGGVQSLVFSQDGTTLISNGWNLIIWHMVPAQTIMQKLVGHKDDVRIVEFSSDGKKLTSWSVDGTEIIWDIANNNIISIENVGERDYNDTNGAGIYWDQNIIISMPDSATIILTDMKTDKRIGQPLVGHNGYINTTAFNSDNSILASGGDDNTIFLWDVFSGQPILKLFGHTDWVYSLAFSPDDKMLASGDKDGTVIIWNIDTESWLEIVCRRAGRNFRQEFWRSVGPNEWNKYFSGEDYRITCPQWPAGE